MQNVVPVGRKLGSEMCNVIRRTKIEGARWGGANRGIVLMYRDE